VRERECLARNSQGKERLVEIGVFHGVNTRAMRGGMTENGVIIAIDPFRRSIFGWRGYGCARKIAHAEVVRAKRGTVIWVENTGKDAVNEEAVKRHLPVDFIFIDGDHSWEGLQGDWESWRGHVRLGGVVALHDVRNTFCGAQKFTEKVILRDAEFQTVEEVDSLLVVKRILPVC
jgi:predicted O-methyltransferase YrrM